MHLLGDLVIRALAELMRSLGVGLGYFDLWCEKRFGRTLTGRMNKLEIQTLFQWEHEGSRPNLTSFFHYPLLHSTLAGLHPFNPSSAVN
jgi:hypothetical protein